MEGPFDTAWTLLKININGPPINRNLQQMLEYVNKIQAQEATENQPYPLTDEEEKFRQLEEKAYTLARKANEHETYMSNDQYEDAIELAAEKILARMIAQSKPDYPWPKKEKFQTTFLDRGNLSFDPMLSRQQKLNARMARESNRREAVPSRIEISPRENNSRGKLISLVNDKGETLSQLSGSGGDNYNTHIHDFYGTTPEPYRRQGMYRKLMQALIGAGIPIKSNERNSQSNAFHQNFLESLPPNITSSYVDEYGNPKTEYSVEDLDYNAPLEYYQNKVPQFFDAQGQRSGLNRQDYGAIPIVNQQKQARNMDELAEQDRAKIRRGRGHEPETQGIIAQQPMARNTLQHRFDPNFENKYPPLYDGYYDNQGNFYDDLDEVVFEGNHP